MPQSAAPSRARRLAQARARGDADDTQPNPAPHTCASRECRGVRAAPLYRANSLSGPMIYGRPYGIRRVSPARDDSGGWFPFQSPTSSEALYLRLAGGSRFFSFFLTSSSVRAFELCYPSRCLRRIQFLGPSGFPREDLSVVSVRCGLWWQRHCQQYVLVAVVLRFCSESMYCINVMFAYAAPSKMSRLMSDKADEASIISAELG